MTMKKIAVIVLVTYRGNKGGEIGWLLELENLESYSSNLEAHGPHRQIHG